MSMPAMKRQASDSFSSQSQGLVKRQKSSSELNNGSAVAVAGGGARNGALTQSVCPETHSQSQHTKLSIGEQGQLMEGTWIGTTNEWIASAYHGVDWSHGGGICNEV